ncbi:BON domain-containing protein [Aurantibacillus circumpalustris]|uniref:BON domain-containing protein n=1 Tax=Aurantibacillus circumpalustris TaxID=3036359 RepID=UPI00295AD395|nr:BON domain-containing protein [Aurantibacillus circumpalustris]
MKTINETQKDSLTENAWMELIDAIKPRDISISVNHGLVTLYGTVTNYSKKLLTEQIVAGVKGVKSIVNRLEVRLNTRDMKNDEELKGDILDAFIKTINEPEETFILKIENEWLMLVGDVKNNLGNKVAVKGKLCKLEEINKNEKRAKHHPAVITTEEMAYWEIFA